jgi:hypothetical protein
VILFVDFQLLQTVENFETLVTLADDMYFAVRFVQDEGGKLVTTEAAHVWYLVLV